MGTEDKKKERRNRRTQKNLYDDLQNAIRGEIREKGFGKATAIGIIQRAGAQANVFYSRYKDIDDVLDKIVREYDYWLNDSIRWDPVELTPIENLENLVLDLIDALESTEVMKKLLVWELSDKNTTTRRTSESRERNTKDLLAYFSGTLKNADVNIDIFGALMVGGIYYLLLHQGLSTFCGIDFSKKESIDYLKKTLHNLIRLIYGNPKMASVRLSEGATDQKMIMVAKTLIKRGVDINIIKEATQLSDEELLPLISAPKKSGRPKKVKSK